MVAIDEKVNTIPPASVHKNTSIADGNILKNFEYVSLSDPLSGPMNVSQVSWRWCRVALK